MMVQVIEGERASAKGRKLFSVTVLPDAGQTPAAVLCWHHGIGEHIGRYEKGERRLWGSASWKHCHLSY